MEAIVKGIYTACPIREQIHILEFYSFFVEHYPYGFCFSGESHAFWECVYVLEGLIQVGADDRVYDMAEGELIIHKPLEFHKFSVVSSGGARVLVFSFSAEGPYLQLLKNKVYLLSNEQRQIIAELLQYGQSKKVLENSAKAFKDLLLPIHSCYEYGQVLTCYLYRLFLAFAEKGEVSCVSSKPEAVLFQRAVNYLRSNVYRQPSLEETAHFCHTSQASLRRAFDKCAGVGVHRYLLQLKIRMATEMLQEETVSSVATKLGFSSSGYFSKVYKRETGRLPSHVLPKR